MSQHSDPQTEEALEVVTKAESNDAIEVEEDSLSKGKVKFESAMQREEAIAYFEAILSGLKQGTVHFRQGDRTVVLKPAAHMEVEVKASRKAKEEKISFEISWRVQEPADLEITAT